MPKTTASPLIAGVDEAGRGPLAGPVVCAAVILPDDFSALADTVINMVRDTRGGMDYSSEYHVRGRGQGPIPDRIAKRFRAGVLRYGLDKDRLKLHCDCSNAHSPLKIS